MKRFYPVIFLISVILLSWSIIASINAQTSVNTLLLAYGQTPIPFWRQVIRGVPMVGTLTDGQLDLYKQARVNLMSDIKLVKSKSAEYFVPVKDPDAIGGSVRVAKDDWLTLEAAPSLAKLDAHIALLEGQ